jgi:hypothetical protein
MQTTSHTDRQQEDVDVNARNKTAGRQAIRDKGIQA